MTEVGRPAACPEPLVAYIVHENNMHRAAIDTAMREGRLLRAKHANSRLPGCFDAIVFRGWIADGQLHSGRPGRAALTYAGTALRTGAWPTRGTRSGRRCGALRLRRPHEPTPYDGEAPDWLALRP